jgi:hypothetical protein
MCLSYWPFRIQTLDFSNLNEFFVSFSDLGAAGSGFVRLFGGTGSDQFFLSHAENWGVGNVHTFSSTPTLAAVTLSGSGLFEYTATGSASGLVELTSPNPGGLTTEYQIVAGALAVQGFGAGATLQVASANATVTPGASPGTGLVEPVDILGNELLPLSYSGIANVALVGGTVVVQGTEADDRITLSAAGQIAVTNNFGFSNVVDVSGYDRVVINALGGDDQIEIAASNLFPGGIVVIGGDNGTGSDRLEYTGGGGNVVVNLNSSSVNEIGASPISFAGIERLNVLAGAGNITVTGSSAEFAVTRIDAHGCNHSGERAGPDDPDAQHRRR